MDYAELAAFARSYGLVYLLVLFAGALVYALWPGNRGRFERAAHIPLNERTPKP